MKNLCFCIIFASESTKKIFAEKFLQIAKAAFEMSRVIFWRKTVYSKFLVFSKFDELVQIFSGILPKEDSAALPKLRSSCPGEQIQWKLGSLEVFLVSFLDLERKFSRHSTKFISGTLWKLQSLWPADHFERIFDFIQKFLIFNHFGTWLENFQTFVELLLAALLSLHSTCPAERFKLGVLFLKISIFQSLSVFGISFVRVVQTAIPGFRLKSWGNNSFEKIK